MVVINFKKKKYIIAITIIVVFVYLLNIFLIKFISNNYEANRKLAEDNKDQYINYNFESQNIDVVYTWVNGSDRKFLNDLVKYLNVPTNSSLLSMQRFDDKNELKYSLRSLEKYANWIRHVYIVTNGQIPNWLNLDYEKVTLVTHQEIFENQNYLPTFSSPAIETYLHRIHGLSDHFIYFNDDVFLNDYLYLDDLVTASSGYKIYLSWLLPDCNLECPWSYLGDDSCDPQCNNPQCQFDGGDCDNSDQQLSTSIDLQENNLSENDINRFNDEPKLLRNSINLTKITDINELVKKYNKKVMLLNKTNRKKTDINLSNQTNNGRFVQNDSYALSLQFVNRLFNIEYKFETRRVIAHSPLFLNKFIINRMKKKFSKQFEQTAKNRFRSENDMQFAFTYFYFIQNEKQQLSISEIFDIFDTDQSGTLSDRELRTLFAKLSELPLKYEFVEEMEKVLINCSKSKQKLTQEISTLPYERYLGSKLPLIIKELIMRCEYVSQLLKKNFGERNVYKYELKNAYNKLVHFKMITSNLNEVINSLDEIRKDNRKFVCLNDNLNEMKKEENEMIRNILDDFYLSLFPLPSHFELPEQYRNKFTQVKDLLKWKFRRTIFKLIIYFFIFLLFIYLFFKCI